MVFHRLFKILVYICIYILVSHNIWTANNRILHIYNIRTASFWKNPIKINEKVMWKLFLFVFLKWRSILQEAVLIFLSWIAINHCKMDESAAETFDEGTEDFPPLLEEVDASTIIVIHPGSRFLRIGLSSGKSLGD